MRSETDRRRIEQFMIQMGARVRGPARIYITGGGSAVIEGWRTMTIDLDLKALPEPAGWFEAIADLKERIDMNVELASPDDFIPPLPGWQERSPLIARHGQVEFCHYDFCSQALAKLERGHERDLLDATAMVERGLITRERLWQLFQEIEPNLIRYPAIEPSAFRAAVETFCAIKP